MKLPSIVSLFFAVLLTPAVAAPHGPSPYQPPEGLVRGAAFIDLIEPMPVPNGLTSDVWGGDNVKPRNADNGIEDAEWSYWCASVIPGPDGKHHMFVCRWLEKSPKGHDQWPRSELARAVGDSPLGPFKVVQELGSGHNAEVYLTKDGTYVVYVIGACYVSKDLNGPWTKTKLEFDTMGNPQVNLSNGTFARREDGGFLMISRGGQVWLSDDGLKPFRMVRSESVYPRIRGRFEDPVVWRDEVQYHLVVNDWFGRTAYYLRSPDGIDWTWDPGKAYDQEVVRHPGGTRESWYKLERPKILQDKHGRATHIYFAAIDCPKEQDKGGDNHSSKSLVLPLTVPKRMRLVGNAPITPATAGVQVEIFAEQGFNPHTDLDLESLRFGSPSEVNFGKGGTVNKSEMLGDNLVITFDGKAMGLKPEDFAAKLLGRDPNGGIVHGWAKIPKKP